MRVNNADVIYVLQIVWDHFRNSGRFEQRRPDRWIHKRTGAEIETGYVYGEATIRLRLDNLSKTYRLCGSKALEFDLFEAIHELEELHAPSVNGEPVGKSGR